MKIGTRLGPYEIVAPLGAGGMGEVYRAQDTKLGRDVAIKVLPEEFTKHPEKLARFEREARLLASLNHPKIATLHGLEKSEDQPFLVMELIEGETLAERIAQGPMPPREALQVATQIAEALETAHDKGVIHRDLKPANIKVDAEGNVKVLDFGLAKALADEIPESDLSASPTLSRDATRAGVILGTATYMSPEQARGKAVDKRTDIFSFGLVLFEMLAGKKAFTGEDVSDVLASIMKLEPDWKALPKELDPRTENLLRRCLRKDRKNRLRDAGDVRIQIQEIFEQPTAPSDERALAVSASRGMREKLVWALGAALVAGLTVWGVMRPEPPAELPITRFPVTLPAGQNFTNAGRNVLALSPDGTRLVYVANEQLHLREMDQMESAPMRGTDITPISPFFSSDGQWVGFYAAGQLRKVSVTGGAPVTLCEAASPFGASWGADDTILFGQGPAGILRVSANGGEPEVIIPTDSDKNEVAHGQPQMLPDGKTVLFTLSTSGSWDDAQIVAQSTETGERRVLIEGGSGARYVATGHLVYAVEETLLAVPFDPERLETIGGPVPVVEGVARANNITGAAHASVSSSGSLVYVPEASIRQGRPLRELVRVDRQGKASLLTDTLGDYEGPRFSPDGQRLAVRKWDETGQQIWLLELSRGTSTKLTFEEGILPLWSPDGQTVFFSSLRAGGSYDIFSKPADGAGPAERVTTGAMRVFSGSITSDGKTLVFRQGGEGVSSSFDIGMVHLEGDGEQEMLLETSFDEHTPKVSPDDQWLAYVSSESGRDEIYVSHFPSGGKWQISTAGGREPMWSRDGRELFYRNGQRMMAVDVSAGPDQAGRPTLLFEGPYDLKDGPGASNYDVTPDGEGFVMIRTPERTATSGPPQQINVVLNWFEELKRLVPTED